MLLSAVPIHGRIVFAPENGRSLQRGVRVTIRDLGRDVAWTAGW
jgi:hypothetical protein